MAGDHTPAIHERPPRRANDRGHGRNPTEVPTDGSYLASDRRMTARKAPTQRDCPVCGVAFVHTQRKYCSPACSREAHKAVCREHARGKYVAAVPKAPLICPHCGEHYVPYRFTQKSCSAADCRQKRNAQANRQKRGYGARALPCYKCGASVERDGPGRRVCDDCRVDRRERGREHEARRRLRSYGLTQETYDALWASQGYACGICGCTEEPTKGWCIDHCHETGVVRGILCSNCNSGIGLLGDDPKRVRSAAEYLEQSPWEGS